MTANDSAESSYTVGHLIRHPKMSAWGPGRILEMEGSKLTIYFRDLPSSDTADGIRTIDSNYVDLELLEDQYDQHLSNLPLYEDGKVKGGGKRVTLDEGVKLFLKARPLGFEDPKYIGDLKSGERAYKWAAHELYIETLGDGKGRALLEAGDIDEARKRVSAVEGRTNLLAVFEKAAFRDGLKDDDAAEHYLRALLDLVDNGLDEARFERLAEAVDGLPSDEGKTSPAKWTVATILPFLADPTQFMFLKPSYTKDCATRMIWELNYSTTLTWLTYKRLVEMSEYLLERLRPLGARDFIDVQSFIYLIGGGLEAY